MNCPGRRSNDDYTTWVEVARASVPPPASRLTATGGSAAKNSRTHLVALVGAPRTKFVPGTEICSPHLRGVHTMGYCSELRTPLPEGP